jgi:hypothetical protein
MYLGTVHIDMQRMQDCSCPPTYEADQRLILKLPSGRLDVFSVLHQSRLLPSTTTTTPHLLCVKGQIVCKEGLLDNRSQALIKKRSELLLSQLNI